MERRSYDMATSPLSKKGGIHIYVSKAYWLVVEPTHLKNISQNGFIFPNFRGENKKSLKPPPSIPKIVVPPNHPF